MKIKEKKEKQLTQAEGLVVRRSRPGLGLGLFATQFIPKRSRVVEYTGTLVPTPEADTMTTKYLFEISSRWTIDGSARSNIARYVNHACKPNCEAEIERNRIFYYALKDIMPGEELTVDYGEEYFDDFIRPRGCKCNACMKDT